MVPGITDMASLAKNELVQRFLGTEDVVPKLQSGESLKLKSRKHDVMQQVVSDIVAKCESS